MLSYIYEECDVSYVRDLAMCIYMYNIILCLAYKMHCWSLFGIL